MKLEKIRIGLIPAIFLLIIFFPIVNDQFHFIKDIKNFENRKLATKPELDIEHLDPFPAAYEKYYNDTFSLRSRIVRAYSIYNLSVFKKSPCREYVTIGNDGWLFLKGEEFDTYTGKNPLTARELLNFKKELERRKKYLEERGCKFYFLIAPAKPNIYPEKMPFEIIKTKDKSMGEELLAYLEKNSTVNCVNLYPTLKANKKNCRTYFSLDNHWTKMGAFYGAQQFISQVHQQFPEVKPLLLNDYIIKERDTLEGNTVKMLGNINYYHDVYYFLIPKQKLKATWGEKQNYVPNKDFPYPWAYEEVNEIIGSKKPKLLIITDSFGEDLFPFVSENFRRSVKIWDNWEYKLNEAIVEKEKPDVFLLIIHEKNLRTIIKGY